MTYRAINPDKARQLRSHNLTWRRVAEMLSLEDRRHPPYQTDSVIRAVREYYGTSRVPSRKRHGRPV